MTNTAYSVNGFETSERMRSWIHVLAFELDFEVDEEAYNFTMLHSSGLLSFVVTDAEVSARFAIFAANHPAGSRCIPIETGSVDVSNLSVDQFRALAHSMVGSVTS